MGNELADEAPYSANNFEGLEADKPVAKSEGENKSNGVTVNLGGMQVTFNIDGASNPQEIMHTIRENLADVADRVGAWLAKSIDNINQNQPLEA